MALTRIQTTAITDKAPGKLFAAKLVPSNGSTAISNFGPFLDPSFSPIYNIQHQNYKELDYTVFLMFLN